MSRQRAAPLALLTLLFHVAPSSLVALLGVFAGVSDSEWYYLSPFEGIVLFLVSVPGTVAMTHIALENLRGRRSSIAEGVRLGWTHWGGAAWVLFRAQLGMALGLILLIVPGLFAGSMWMLALPIKITSRDRSSGALAQSEAITAPHRGRLVGLFALYLFGCVAGYLLLSYGPQLVAWRTTEVWVWHIPAVILDPIAFGLMALIGAVGPAVVFDHLSGSSDRIAELFD